MNLFVRENLWAISVSQCFVNWKGWKPKPGIGPVGQVTNPPDWLFCNANSHIMFCACHWAMALRASGQRNRSGPWHGWAIPKRDCTKQVHWPPPVHTRRRIRSSMAKLGRGGDGRIWHCCQVDNLHRTGIGWDGMAVPRSAQQRSPPPGKLQQKGTTSQHRRSVFTIGRTSLELSLFVTKPSQQKMSLLK